MVRPPRTQCSDRPAGECAYGRSCTIGTTARRNETQSFAPAGAARPVLTARTDTVERIAALDAGADDFVTKPFDLGELLARARALLRRNTGTATLQMGPLSLFLAERRATLAGKPIDFTPIELNLIALLARRSGTNISRAKILTKVWETTTDINSNVIEVQVRNIRDKLGPFAPMIQTVRGAGYRLVPPESQDEPARSLESEPPLE